MKETFISGLEQTWATIAVFLPKFAIFLVILLGGYYVAKWLGKLTDTILERVGFDRVVERGGIKRALERTRYDASDILAKIVFYTIFLFVLQMAFGIFGANPISDLINRVILFVPKLLVALVIVVVAAAIGNAAKELTQVALGNLSYGLLLGRLAGAAIVCVGIFAALSQINIAPAIVNGLFYAALAIVAGSAIVAIGGGGIAPMRAQWDKALKKVEQEAPRIKSEAQRAAPAKGTSDAWGKPLEVAPKPA